MSDDVAAVFAKAPCLQRTQEFGIKKRCAYRGHDGSIHPECALAALAKAGYAVLKLPEGDPRGPEGEPLKAEDLPS